MTQFFFNVVLNIFWLSTAVSSVNLKTELASLLVQLICLFLSTFLRNINHNDNCIQKGYLFQEEKKQWTVIRIAFIVFGNIISDN